MRTSLVATTLFALSACQGATGPQGPKGDPGPKGDKGDTGQAADPNAVAAALATDAAFGTAVASGAATQLAANEPFKAAVTAGAAAALGSNATFQGAVAAGAATALAADATFQGSVSTGAATALAGNTTFQGTVAGGAATALAADTTFQGAVAGSAATALAGNTAFRSALAADTTLQTGVKTALAADTAFQAAVKGPKGDPAVITVLTKEEEVLPNGELSVELPSTTTPVLGVQAWVWDPGTSTWKLFNRGGGVEVTQVPNVTPSGLVGYWKLEEESGAARSDSANDNDLVDVLASPTGSGAGIKGDAASFSGQQILGVSNSVFGTTPLNVTGSFSLVAWFLPTILPDGTSVWAPVGMWRDPGNWDDVQFAFWFYADLTFRGVLAGCTQGVPQQQAALDTWTHWALTLDGTSTARLYKNGSLVASKPCAPLSGNNRNVTLGWGLSTLTRGLVDEVAVFNRALTLDEVQSIRDNGVDGGLGVIDKIEVQHDPVGKVVKLVNRERIKLTLRLAVSHP